MAIAIDQADIGHAHLVSGTTTVAFTTTATVASGGFIVLGIGWFLETTTLSSVGGGSLSWSIDKQGANPTGVADSIAVASAQAPSGLASGTTITATFSAATDAKVIGGMSFTGVATSSPVDGTPGAVQGAITTTAWSTASQSITAGSVMVAASYGEGNAASSTVTSPATKGWDEFDLADDYSLVAGYYVNAAGGATTIAGTWNAAIHSTVAAVAYLAAAGGGGAEKQSFYAFRRRSVRR